MSQIEFFSLWQDTERTISVLKRIPTDFHNNLFHEYLLKTYSVRGTILAAEDIAVYKTFALIELAFLKKKTHSK